MLAACGLLFLQIKLWDYLQIRLWGRPEEYARNYSQNCTVVFSMSLKEVGSLGYIGIL